jgi:peptidoglycan/xylan/chitin deacetylase (PgdA/CDA1 family)
MKEIPILLYNNIGHYTAEMMEDGLSAEAFAFQMRFLADNGYGVVTLDQAVAHLMGEIKLPPKSIAITIDGGYNDAFTNALPVLRKHNFPATFFIIPEFIGSTQVLYGGTIQSMSWRAVEELYQSGYELGILTYEGQRISEQDDVDAMRQSISASLQLLKRSLNARVKYCAFRQGIPGKPLWNYLRSLGFEAVFTQSPTNLQPWPSGIGRIQIDDEDPNIFLTKISATYLYFKDRPSWKYVRQYKLDHLAHRISETWSRIKFT